MRKVGLLDTSLYCCWLRIPGKQTAGQGKNAWDPERVDRLIRTEIQNGATLVLPLATLIETGNHIAQAPGNIFHLAQRFCEHIQAAVANELPWVPFIQQLDLWTEARLLRLAKEWPALAVSHLSFGDATIKDIADYYALAGLEVSILTADEQLRSYQPTSPRKKPRRLI